MGSTSTYHSILRIATAVVAIMLVFQSGLMSDTTALLAENTQSYLANAVGVSVGVTPTELNQMTAALTARERELEARELAIAEREIAVNIDGGGVSTRDTSTFILATILFILLVLIILNYALDYARSRERVRQQVVV